MTVMDTKNQYDKDTNEIHLPDKEEDECDDFLADKKERKPKGKKIKKMRFSYDG